MNVGVCVRVRGAMPAAAQMLDKEGNVIASGADDDGDDDPSFNVLTAGMSEDERDAFRLRTLDRDMLYADTNPILVHPQ